MKEDAHWLNRERPSIYRVILVLLMLLFLALFLVTGLGLVLTSKNMADSNGLPLGRDFMMFWAASHLALTGHALDAYSIPLQLKAEQLVVPEANIVRVWYYYVWYYPPTFYLVVLPFALLPYLTAYWTFMLSTLGGYFFVLRRIVRGDIAMWCLVAFPGLWLNLLHGQNGFLTASLAGAALLNVERRPVLAGVFIGLLAIKPHLALLFPVALLAIGAWRTLITAAVTAITFTAISTAILGTAVLEACLAKLGYARLLLEKGVIPWSFSPSVFAFLRMFGIPVTWAYVAHFAVAALAVIVVWRVWRDCPNRNLRGAALMTATFLVTPYVFGYDLAWLAFPIAWLALDGLRSGWLRGEREVLVAAWLLPMLMLPIATDLKLYAGPLVLCSLLWITYRRSAASMSGALATGSHAEQFEIVS
jgi:hypothetical protein